MARINGNNGNNTLNGTGKSDKIYGKGGDDRIDAKGGNDYVDGGSGDDWIDGGTGNDKLKGGSGEDTLIGGAGADKLYGGNGNDILRGDGDNPLGAGSGSGSGSHGRGSGSGSGSHGRGSGSGSGSRHGSGSGSGSNDVSFNDYLNGGSGDDIVLGELGNDTLKGGSGNDILDGGVGRDHVDGDSGDDTGVFVGGENGGGVDWYDGGKGTDTLVISLTGAQFADSGIQSDLFALQSFIAGNSDASTDGGARKTFSNLGIKVQDWEDLVVLVDGEPVELELDPLFTVNPDGVDFDDVQAGTYEDGTQYDALESDDVVTLASNAAEAAEAGYDTNETFNGGDGNDTITGRGLDDKIDGGAGDDTINGGAGDDLIHGDNSTSVDGASETRLATGNAAAWADAGVTLSALDFDGAPATVTYDGDGVGVAGGSPVGNQINHDEDGSSETLVAAFDAPASEATVTVARMFATENGGEQGAWHAYDANGNLVGQGEFGPEITGGGNVGSFTISDIGPFSEVRFTGREYADGTPSGSSDSSDYYVQSIEYTTVVGTGGETGDDIIDGGAGDDLIYGDNADEGVPGGPFLLGGRDVPEAGYDVDALWNQELYGYQVTVTPFSNIDSETVGEFDFDTKGGEMRGLGVEGGDPEVNGSEGIEVDFGGLDLTEVTVGLRALFTEGQPADGVETATWTAFKDGVEVASGEIDAVPGAPDGRVEASIEVPGGFDTLQFSLDEAGSDFHLEYIEGVAPSTGEGGDDIIVGGVGDDEIYGQGGNDIIDGDAPTTIEIRDIANDDGCFDISGTCEVTLTVDFLESLAGYDNSFGYYLAGDDGLPVSGSVVWANVKTGGDGVGDAVTINLEADDLNGATKLGFFVIPNGANKNPGLSDGDDVTFAQSGSDWSVLQDGTPLSGQGADVLFSDENQNPGGYDHEEDAAPVGNMNWEDIVGGGDHDYNDASFNVSVEGAYFASGIVYDGAAGSGSGSASGHAHGSGSGSASGHAHGSGSGSASGHAHGSGSGSASGHHGRGSGSGSASGHHGRGSGSGSGSASASGHHGSGSASGSGRGSHQGSASHGGSGTGVEVTFNDYLDGGAGDDVLDGNLGADFVYGNSGNDTGEFVVGEWGGLDRYDGGTGTDTLKVFVTSEQYADPDIQSDLVALQAFIDANSDPLTDSGATMTFTHLDLEVQDWEELEIYVDGKIVEEDDPDNPADAIDDTASVGEDGPGVVIDVLNNDDVPDGVSGVTISTPPGQGSATVNPDNTITYDPAGEFEDLAEGETATVTFNYEVTDTDGDTDIATVTVTITGTNDEPTITVVPGNGDSVDGDVKELADGDAGENADDLTANGSITFDDADLSDGHTISASPNGGSYIGTFGAVIGTAATGAGEGAIDWDFSVNDSVLESLNEGEQIVQSYDVTIDDGNGGTDTQTVTITIEGTNDAPIVQDVTVTGAIEDGSTVSGSFDGDDADNEDDGSSLTYDITNPPSEGSVANNGDGTFTFDPEDDFQDLAEGETRDVTFTYEATDAQSAVSNTGTVTITVTGTNDEPTITVVPGNGDSVDGDVKELADGDAGENTDDLTASGSITFDDADLSDGHTISASPNGGSYLGTFNAAIATAATGAGEGAIDWDFSVNDSVLDSLNEGETLTQSYDVTIDDGNGGSATQTVTITIEGTNDAPVVQDVTVTGVLEDGASVTDSFVGDDDDAEDDGSTLDYAITSAPSEGSVINNNDGTFTFDPEDDFQDLADGETRDVTFEYTATDARSAVSNTGTVTITVTGTNDEPTITVVPGNSDSVDGDVKELTDGDAGENTDDLTASGSITFDDADLTDGHTISASPNGGSYIGTFNANITTAAAGVGAGSIDWDFSVNDSTLDSLNEGETLVQSYDVTVDDGNGGTATQTVTITIEGTNDAPIVQDVTVTGAIEDGATVTDNFVGDDDDAEDDGSTLDYAITSAPSEGSVINNNDGTFTFDPEDDFQDLAVGETRDVTFTYEATDAQSAVSNTGTVTVTVVGTNDDPVVQDITGSVSEDGPVLVDAFDGDDPDSDDNPTTLTYTITSTPVAGLVINNGDGTFSFDPNGEFESLADGETDVVTFTYEATDSHGAVSNTATVTVTINGENDDPVAQDDVFTVTEDIVLTGNVLADNGNGADSDIDASDTISVVETSITTAEGGTVVIGPDGSFSYTPPLHFSGTDSFDYTIEDDFGAQDTATANITVIPDADIPNVTVVSPARGNAGDPIPLDITIEFPDQDGSEIHEITLCNVPEGAVLNNGTDLGNGEWSLSPADLTGLTITMGATAPAFESTYDITSLLSENGGDGSQGFVLYGVGGQEGDQDLPGNSGTDSFGYDVSSLGDVNGDGIDDFIVSAILGEGTLGPTNQGEAYVVFGSDQGFDPEFQAYDLYASQGGDGSQGFVIAGAEEDDRLGVTVRTAGDMNGDGINDILVGSFKANANGINDTGQAYVIYGTDQGFDAHFNVTEIDGTNGYTINGDPLNPLTSNDFMGYALSGGYDVDGDGNDDLILGSRGNERADGGADHGSTYIVLGGAANLAARDAADGTVDGQINTYSTVVDGVTMFEIEGADRGDHSAVSVSGTNDLNGDGIDDILIGARHAERAEWPDLPGLAGQDGAAYIVFGGLANLQSFDLDDGTADGELMLEFIDGTNGYVFYGSDTGDRAGRSVSDAGDVNGDGLSDILIGAYFADGQAGEAYVVYGGSANFAALDAEDGTVDGAIDLAELQTINGGDGSAGFLLNGEAAGDRLGINVRSAGDINGDGIDDIIVGANYADGGTLNAGSSYIIFGSTDGFDAEIDLADIRSGDGSQGFVIDGLVLNDLSGTSVSGAGDVNADGIDDLIVGAFGGNEHGGNTGEAYVIFGRHGLSTEDFTMTVKATATEQDNGDTETTTEPLIVDINEAPDIGDYLYDLDENSPSGTTVGMVMGTDPDVGDTLDYAIVGGSGVGVFDIDVVSGEITVIDASALDFETNPVFTLTVEVTDDFGLTDTGVVTINLNDVFENSLVDAVDDSANAVEDGPGVIIDVTDNDDVPDGVSSVTILTGPGEGSASVNPDNTITFDPGSDFQDLAPGETRDVTFTYEVEDPQGDTDIATVTVTVLGTNDDPVVQNVTTAVGEDGPAVSGSFDGDDPDSDDDGSTLAYTITTPPSEGSVVNNNDGTFSFDPDGDFEDLAVGETRDVTFEYTATDSHGAVSNIGTVTVTVTGSNDGPVAEDDVFSMAEDTSLSGDLLLDNGNGPDSDVDGDPLSVVPVAQAVPFVPAIIDGSHDSVTGEWTVDYAGAPGSQTLTQTDLVTFDPGVSTLDTLFPGASFLGSNIIDGGAGVNVLYGSEGDDVIFGGVNTLDDVTLNTFDDFLYANGGNDVLIGGDGYDVYYVGRGDGDNHILDGNTMTGAFSNGLVLFEGFENNNNVDIDFEDEQGNDLGVSASDVQFVNNNDGTWTIFFTDGSGSVTFASNEISDINLLDNQPGGTGGVTTVYTFDDGGTATDYSDDSYVGSIIQTGDDGAGVIETINGGFVALKKDGTFDYTPAPDFVGVDTFEYTITDPHGATDTATVSITVNNVNDAPVVEDVALSVSEDGPAQIDNFVGDDPDPDDDGSTLIYTITTPPSEGSVVNNNDGTFSFDPDGDFEDLAVGETRDVTFEYTATDSHGAVSNTGTITVTVTGTNDDPEISIAGTDDSGSVTELTDADAGENTDDLSATGTIAFDDADLSDGHTVSAAPNGGGYIGTFNAVLGTAATGAGAGEIDWDFTVNDALLDSLNLGDEIVQSYDVSVDDENGGSAVQTVTITMTGTNDAPEISFAAGEDTGSVDEDDASNTVSGQLDGSDVDTGALENWSVVGGPAGDYGDLTVDGSGAWTYTLDNSNPLLEDLDTGETFTDSFTIELADEHGATDTQTVTVTINGNTDNELVLAVDDTGAASEDGPFVDIDVTANDSFPDGLGGVTIITGPSAGTASVNPDNTIRFDPAGEFEALAPGETTDVTIVYELEDADGDTAQATVTITVTGTNDAPVVQNVGPGEDFTAVEDGLSFDAGFDGDDIDSDDDPSTLIYTITSSPSEGVATNNNDGTFNFDPASDFQDLAPGQTRDVTFEYTATDSHGAVSNTGLVTVTVLGTNDAPVVQDVAAAAQEDGAPVTGNFDGDDIDSDDDATTLTYTITSAPSEGSVVNNNDGTFSFDPGTDFQYLAPGETTDVTFDYTATDSHSAVSNTGTVTVTVTGTNDAPVVEDVAVGGVIEDGAAVGGSFIGDDPDSDDDGTTIIYNVTSTPSEGSVTNNNDGTFSFDPGSDFQDLAVGETRDVTFDYTATDSHSAVSNTGTVTITVTGTNDDPIVQDMTLSVDEDGPAVVDLFDGDDPDSDDDQTTLNYTLTSTPLVGLLVNNGDGTFSFDPNGEFNSLASGESEDVTFTYEATDSHGAISNTGTVTITVNGANDGPSGADDAFTGTEDIALLGNVLADNGSGADSDPDATDTLSVVETSITTAEGGTVTMSANGDFTYTPFLHFSGTDSFTYTVSDGNGGTDTATVTIDVEAVVDQPTVTASDVSTTVDVATPISISALFPDQDGSEIHTLTLSDVPDNVTFNNGTKNPDGTWTLSEADLSGLELFVDSGPVFGPFVDLFELDDANGGDGSEGFILNGGLGGIASGYDVASAGDVNGDGFADVLTSAILGDPDGMTNAGYVYVYFGGATHTAETNLHTMNTSLGYRFDGVGVNDTTGVAVRSAGDVNNDGYDDIFIGSNRADVGAAGDAGRGYVVFGSAGNANFADLDDDDGTADGIIKLSNLLAVNGGDGSKGFVVNGTPETASSSNDFGGYSLGGAIDFNGDGIDDIFFGARGNDWFRDLNGNGMKDGGETVVDAGSTYVMFGMAGGFAAEFNVGDLMDANGDANVVGGVPGGSQGIGDGSAGIVIRGINNGDQSGYQLAGVRDMNNDGYDEILIGARQADPNGLGNSGSAYLVFGHDTVGAPELILSDIDGTNGFAFNGVGVNDRLGRAVGEAGDVNGDGINDIIIGAYNNDIGGSNSGAAYVVFGGTASLSDLDDDDGTADGQVQMAELLAANGGDGSKGFVLIGDFTADNAGWYVQGAGDINNDGFEDVLIGAPRSDAIGKGTAGETYVIFGNETGFAPEIDLSDLETGSGEVGFVFRGIDAGDFSGWTVNAAGDVNGDGIDDVIIGAYLADPNGSASGETYVVYGKQQLGIDDFTIAVTGTSTESSNGDTASDTTSFLVDLDTNPDEILTGTAGADTIDGADGDDIINGLGGDDTLLGGSGYDQIFGGAGNDNIDGGIDNVAGGGHNQLYGGDGNDIIEGSNTTDVIFGDDGEDTITGNGGMDLVYGGSGNDTISGSADIDNLNGGDDDDTISGDAGDDVINGDAGNDILNGGAGNDVLTGSSGDDLFIFENGTGDDTVQDFVAGSGTDDVADVTDFGFTDFADLLASTNDSGSDTVITLDGDDSLTLIGVQKADLHEDDFLI